MANNYVVRQCVSCQRMYCRIELITVVAVLSYTAIVLLFFALSLRDLHIWHKGESYILVSEDIRDLNGHKVSQSDVGSVTWLIVMS